MAIKNEKLKEVREYFVYVDYTNETSPRAFYVGKGSQARLQSYVRNPRHAAISKAHGIYRKIVFSSRLECDAFDVEQRLIRELKTRADLPDQWGANFTKGGEGVCGRNHDTRTKHQIGRRLKGRRMTEKTRQNMRVAQSKKPIVQYGLNGQVIARYVSQCEAHRQTIVAASNIGKCCRRELKSAGGFVWRFFNDQFDPKLPTKLSQEHRKKLSISHAGLHHSDQTRRKISLNQLGQRLSISHKQNISYGLKAYYRKVKDGNQK